MSAEPGAGHALVTVKALEVNASFDRLYPRYIQFLSGNASPIEAEPNATTHLGRSYHLFQLSKKQVLVNFGGAREIKVFGVTLTCH